MISMKFPISCFHAFLLLHFSLATTLTVVLVYTVIRTVKDFVTLSCKYRFTEVFFFYMCKSS